MPELPEVETTRRGIIDHVEGRKVVDVVVRNGSLRWPVPECLAGELTGQVVQSISRRGKYLLFRTAAGHVLIHLGMSGSLRVVARDVAVGPHDHLDIVLDSGRSLRLRDPRRFGAVLWTTDPPSRHRLLRDLGPEPLDDAFDGSYLKRAFGERRTAVKQAIMNSKIVVGVGNIYASEALFRAGIRPARAAGRVSRKRCEMLAGAIVDVLSEAIEQGGTTLRDFLGGDGEPGYFKQSLQVYDREGLGCVRCDGTVRKIRQGGRATYFCEGCQR